MRNAPSYTNLLRQGYEGQEAPADRDCGMSVINTSIEKSALGPSVVPID